MSELSEAILRLKAEGKTYNEIKATLGCSKGTISYHLGAGQKVKTLGRQRHRRSEVRALIQEAKNNIPCMDCGEPYPYWVMDFDHRDPSLKNFNISMYATSITSVEKVKEEMDKCDIVCANCHRTRSHLRQLKSVSEESLKLFEVFE